MYTVGAIQVFILTTSGGLLTSWESLERLLLKSDKKNALAELVIFLCLHQLLSIR